MKRKRNRHYRRHVPFALLIALTLVVVPVPNASAGGGADACAGGVDASNDQSAPSDLEKFGGCHGQLYRLAPQEDGTDDLKDAYTFRQEGMGTAQINFRLCNEGSGVLFYEVLWRTDVLTWKKIDTYYAAPGECTTEDPAPLTAGYKPGTWIIVIWTLEDEIAAGDALPYDLHAQPLWR